MTLSLTSKASLAIAVAIMMGFFAYQTALVIGYAEVTDSSPLIGG